MAWFIIRNNPDKVYTLKLTDYPNTALLIEKYLKQAERIRPSHKGFIAALNKVRVDVGIQPIDINELILATLGRVEDKINATQDQVRPETWPESREEQISSEKTSCH